MALFTLEKLRHLNISDNFIRHTIPPEIGSLKNLEVLDFHGNCLEGPLPDNLSQLKKLHYFHIFNSIASEAAAAPFQFDAERYQSLCMLHEKVGIDSFSCFPQNIYGISPSLKERDEERALIKRFLNGGGHRESI